MFHRRTTPDFPHRAIAVSHAACRGLVPVAAAALLLGFSGCGQSEPATPVQVAAPKSGIVGRWGPSEAEAKRLAQLDMAMMRSKEFLPSGADLQKRLNGEVGSDTYRINIAGDKERQEQREKIQRMSDAELEQYALQGIVRETLTFQADGKVNYATKTELAAKSAGRAFEGSWTQEGDSVTAKFPMPKELVEPFGPEIVMKVHVSGDRLFGTEVTGMKTSFMLKNTDGMIREWSRTK